MHTYLVERIYLGVIQERFYRRAKNSHQIRSILRLWRTGVGHWHIQRVN